MVATARHQTQYLHTPDGRYFVVRGRLWRLSNPDLCSEVREQLVAELMRYRRGVRAATAASGKNRAIRARIHAVKVALGERGPVWWTDGQPDYNRHKIENTPYRYWYA